MNFSKQNHVRFFISICIYFLVVNTCSSATFSVSNTKFNFQQLRQVSINQNTDSIVFARKLRWKDSSNLEGHKANWSDPANWQQIEPFFQNDVLLPPQYCDTVLFDSLSFSANLQVVNVDVQNPSVASLLWQNLKLPAVFSSTICVNFTVNGNLEFDPLVVQKLNAPFLMKGKPSKRFPVFYLKTGKIPVQHIIFEADSDSTVWILKDDLIDNCNYSYQVAGIEFRKGSFYSNGFDLTSQHSGLLISNPNKKTISFENSIVKLYDCYRLFYPDSVNLITTQSTFLINAYAFTNLSFKGGGKQYDRVIFDFPSVETGSYVLISDGDTFNTLEFLNSHPNSWARIYGNATLNVHHLLTKSATFYLNTPFANIDTFSVYGKNNYINSSVRFGKKMFMEPGCKLLLGKNNLQYFDKNCSIYISGNQQNTTYIQSSDSLHAAIIISESDDFCFEHVAFKSVQVVKASDSLWENLKFHNVEHVSVFGDYFPNGELKSTMKNCIDQATYSTENYVRCNSNCLNEGKNKGIRFVENRGVQSIQFSEKAVHVCEGDSLSILFEGRAKLPFTVIVKDQFNKHYNFPYNTTSSLLAYDSISLKFKANTFLNPNDNLNLTIVGFYSDCFPGVIDSSNNQLLVHVKHDQTVKPDFELIELCSNSFMNQINFTKNYEHYSWESYSAQTNGVNKSRAIGPIQDTLFNTSDSAYSITYRIYPDGDKCTSDEPYNINVIVNPLPDVNFPKKLNLSCEESMAQFQVEGINGGNLSVHWSDQSLKYDSTKNIFRVSNPSNYLFFVKDTNTQCSRNYSVMVDPAIDTVQPQVNCPESVCYKMVSNETDSIELDLPKINDNCSIKSINWELLSIDKINLNSGSGYLKRYPFDIGTNIINYKVKDQTGNQSVCTFQIQIVDTIVPNLVCPKDTVIGLSEPSDGNIEIYSITKAYDNCAVDRFECLLKGESVTHLLINEGENLKLSYGKSEIQLLLVDISDNTQFCKFYSYRFPNFLEAPEELTPNGDSVNDSWKIKHLENFQTISLTISSKNGRQVFQTNNPNAEWNGRLYDPSVLAHDELPNGTYYYEVKVTVLVNQRIIEKSYTGKIHLKF